MSELPAFNPATEFARPPWTADQVASLNGYQQSGVMHEFTCGNTDCRRVSGKPLTAAEDGWHCSRCGYTQDWAHPWMADWSWQRGLPAGFVGGFASGGHGGPDAGFGFRDLPFAPGSGPLLGPLRSPLPRPRASYPVTLPVACYRAAAGFMVHVKPGCRCSR